MVYPLEKYDLHMCLADYIYIFFHLKGAVGGGDHLPSGDPWVSPLNTQWLKIKWKVGRVLATATAAAEESIKLKKCMLQKIYYVLWFWFLSLYSTTNHIS